jgi:hypothetical protein
MASNTLFSLTFETVRALKYVGYGTVTTAGTTVSFTDALRKEASDAFNDGTIWLTYDAGGAGAAPQGEYGTVSDFASGGTITFSAFTAAPAAGDKYAIAKKRYTLAELVGAVNEAITDLGPIEITDTTTIDLIASTKEYSLPDVPNLRLKEVWIQGQTGLTNDNAWYPISNYYVQKSATGTADKIVFADSYPINRSVKIVYTGLHNTLTASTSEADDSIDKRIIYNMAAINLLEKRITRIGDDDGSMTNHLNDLKMRLQEAKQDTPKPRVSKKPHYLIVGGAREDRFPTVEDLGNV